MEESWIRRRREHGCERARGTSREFLGSKSFKGWVEFLYVKEEIARNSALK